MRNQQDLLFAASIYAATHSFLIAPNGFSHVHGSKLIKSAIAASDRKLPRTNPDAGACNAGTVELIVLIGVNTAPLISKMFQIEPVCCGGKNCRTSVLP